MPGDSGFGRRRPPKPESGRCVDVACAGVYCEAGAPLAGKALGELKAPAAPERCASNPCRNAKACQDLVSTASILSNRNAANKSQYSFPLQIVDFAKYNCYGRLELFNT